MDYLLLFIALVILFLLYNKIALLYNIVDIPNERSSHSTITIRGGGIIFPISILFWFINSGFHFLLFFLGLLIISIVSYWDDIKHLPSKHRLLIHIIALILLFIQTELYNLPAWVWIPIIILLAGIINAFNFMDGINGITGGYSLSVLFGIWLVNNFQENFIDNSFIYYIIIPVIIFIFFNFRIKAKCFAGDVGSISIAYIIVFLLAKLIIQTDNLLYILFLTVYGVDTIFTIIHRIINKENIFLAHRKHVYQLLANEFKISHVKVALFYSLLQLIICIIVIFVYKEYQTLLSSIIIALCLLSLTSIIFYFLRIRITQRRKIA